MDDLRPTSADGTVVHGWVTGSGTPVLLCDGLGSSAAAWPALVAAGSGLQVAGWHYRGLGGSPRPRDETRITVDDHIDDALAVLDAAGLARAVVVSWSIGVNVAFELARRAPDRVAGVMAVAGVPGGTFGAMLGALPLPARLRLGAAVSTAHVMRAAAPLIGPLARRVAPTPRLIRALVATRLVDDGVDVDAMCETMEVFRQHDVRWYFTLALALVDHLPMELRDVGCPVLFVAGTSDHLTAHSDVSRAAARVPDAQLEVLPGTHYLPVEHPTAMRALLSRLVERTSA
ncbi:MAG TPA: alpha/beta hydrolase [Mycobacteriales bacterium]|nr:alpha/beta hydrolase [Mycobacteriales bacterium]